MMPIFQKMLQWAQWLVGAIPVSKLRSPLAYRIAHYSIVVILTLGLGYFSPWIKDPAEIDLPFYFVRRFWFGILFFLSYIVLRLVISLIALLMARDEPEFADIERDWNEGMAGLQRQGLDLCELPVVIVNGMTPTQERNFFDGARTNWKCIAPAPENQAVLRFYAKDDAIFISCSGVGATSMQAQMVPVAAPSLNVGATMIANPGVKGAVVEPTMMPGELQAARKSILSGMTLKPEPQEVPGGTVRAVGKLASYVRESIETMMPNKMVREAMLSVKPVNATLAPLSADQLHLARRRMQYFSSLLIRDRLPCCPINGLVQVVPLTWAEQERDLDKICKSVSEDLQNTIRNLQMQFPTVLAISSLEQLNGYVDFTKRVEKLDPRVVNSRAGTRFPAGQPVDDENSSWAVERCFHWLRGWVYSALSSDVGDAVGNRRLFRMLCHLNEYRKGMKKLVEFSCNLPEEARSLRLSGIYFVANGQGTARQGFLKGVLDKILSEQNDVAWTQSKVATDRRYGILSTILFAAAGLLLIANVALAFLLITRNS